MREIRNQTFKDCDASDELIKDVYYLRCSFANLVISDVLFENLRFVNCTFDRIIIEASSLSNVYIKESKIESISFNGLRKITKRSLFKSDKTQTITKLHLDYSNEIIETDFSGNLKFQDCVFPQGDNYIHLAKPLIVYQECENEIRKHWDGRKREIGLKEINEFYLSKSVEKQNEDFVVYSENQYLDEEINGYIRSVFDLVRDTATRHGLVLNQSLGCSE